MKKIDKQTSGFRILTLFIIFFLCFCSVDAFFVYSAYKSNTGLITENSYYKGLDFNKTLLEAKKQKLSGIQGTTKYSDNSIFFTLHDADNNPIDNANVIASFSIPTHNGYDFKKSLMPTGNGQYKSNVVLPTKGLWIAHIEAKWENQRYKTMLTFTVNP